MTAPIPVPAALSAAYASWCARGRPSQAPVTIPAHRWRAAFARETALTRLPERLDRDALSAIFARARGEQQILQPFFAVMAWGYGTAGYGPSRTKRIIVANADLASRLATAARLARDAGGAEAFAYLRGHRIAYLGPAFATKFLFFAGRGTEAKLPGLILDSKLRSWLCTHTGWRPGGTWQVDYNRYLRTIADWAGRLESPGLAPETVEELIFTSHSATTASAQKACSHPASARL